MFYSWDVMEPIAYMMLLSNFVIGLFFYTMQKKNMELETLREMLGNTFARRLYRKNGLDIEKLEKLETQI